MSTPAPPPVVATPPPLPQQSNEAGDSVAAAASGAARCEWFQPKFFKTLLPRVKEDDASIIGLFLLDQAVSGMGYGCFDKRYPDAHAAIRAELFPHLQQETSRQLVNTWIETNDVETGPDALRLFPSFQKVTVQCNGLPSKKTKNAHRHHDDYLDDSDVTVMVTIPTGSENEENGPGKTAAIQSIIDSGSKAQICLQSVGGMIGQMLVEGERIIKPSRLTKKNRTAPTLSLVRSAVCTVMEKLGEGSGSGAGSFLESISISDDKTTLAITFAMDI